MILSRRKTLIAGAGALAAGLAGRSRAQTPPSASEPSRIVKKGRLKQSVSRWCYQRIPMPDFCKAVAAMGLTAVDLLQPNEWEQVEPYGLICSMGYAGGGTIPKGLNDKTNHDGIVKGFELNIPLA